MLAASGAVWTEGESLYRHPLHIASHMRYGTSCKVALPDNYPLPSPLPPFPAPLTQVCFGHGQVEYGFEYRPPSAMWSLLLPPDSRLLSAAAALQASPCVALDASSWQAAAPASTCGDDATRSTCSSSSGTRGSSRGSCSSVGGCGGSSRLVNAGVSSRGSSRGSSGVQLTSSTASRGSSRGGLKRRGSGDAYASPLTAPMAAACVAQAIGRHFSCLEVGPEASAAQVAAWLGAVASAGSWGCLTRLEHMPGREALSALQLLWDMQHGAAARRAAARVGTEEAPQTGSGSPETLQRQFAVFVGLPDGVEGAISASTAHISDGSSSSSSGSGGSGALAASVIRDSVVQFARCIILQPADLRTAAEAWMRGLPGAKNCAEAAGCLVDITHAMAAARRPPGLTDAVSLHRSSIADMLMIMRHVEQQLAAANSAGSKQGSGYACMLAALQAAVDRACVPMLPQHQRAVAAAVARDMLSEAAASTSPGNPLPVPEGGLERRPAAFPGESGSRLDHDSMPVFFSWDTEQLAAAVRSVLPRGEQHWQPAQRCGRATGDVQSPQQQLQGVDVHNSPQLRPQHATGPSVAVTAAPLVGVHQGQWPAVHAQAAVQACAALHTALQATRAAFLTGRPGCGKTLAWQVLAAAYGLEGGTPRGNHSHVDGARMDLVCNRTTLCISVDALLHEVVSNGERSGCDASSELCSGGSRVGPAAAAPDCPGRLLHDLTLRLARQWANSMPLEVAGCHGAVITAQERAGLLASSSTTGADEAAQGGGVRCSCDGSMGEPRSWVQWRLLVLQCCTVSAAAAAQRLLSSSPGSCPADTSGQPAGVLQLLHTLPGCVGIIVECTSDPASGLVAEQASRGVRGLQPFGTIGGLHVDQLLVDTQCEVRRQLGCAICPLPLTRGDMPAGHSGLMTNVEASKQLLDGLSALLIDMASTAVSFAGEGVMAQPVSAGGNHSSSGDKYQQQQQQHLWRGTLEAGPDSGIRESHSADSVNKDGQVLQAVADVVAVVGVQWRRSQPGSTQQADETAARLALQTAAWVLCGRCCRTPQQVHTLVDMLSAVVHGAGLQEQLPPDGDLLASSICLGTGQWVPWRDVIPLGRWSLQGSAAGMAPEGTRAAGAVVTRAAAATTPASLAWEAARAVPPYSSIAWPAEDSGRVAAVSVRSAALQQIVEVWMEAGLCPLLLGPKGCGKGTALRQLLGEQRYRHHRGPSDSSASDAEACQQAAGQPAPLQFRLSAATSGADMIHLSHALAPKPVGFPVGRFGSSILQEGRPGVRGPAAWWPQRVFLEGAQLPSAAYAAASCARGGGPAYAGLLQLLEACAGTRGQLQVVASAADDGDGGWCWCPDWLAHRFVPLHVACFARLDYGCSIEGGMVGGRGSGSGDQLCSSQDRAEGQQVLQWRQQPSMALVHASSVVRAIACNAAMQLRAAVSRAPAESGGVMAVCAREMEVRKQQLLAAALAGVCSSIYHGILHSDDQKGSQGATARGWTDGQLLAAFEGGLARAVSVVAQVAGEKAEEEEEDQEGVGGEGDDGGVTTAMADRLGAADVAAW